MAYEGGYTSAINSQQSRAMQEAYRQAEMQRMVQTAIAFQQQQQQRERQARARAGLAEMLPELTQIGRPPPEGAQPPEPGASSQPMARPQPVPMPSPAGPIPPPPGVGPASPPSAAAAAAPMPPGAGTGAPMPKNGLPAAAAPPGAAPGWKPLPKPPEAAQAGPGGIPPPPGEGAVMPRTVISVGDLTKLLASKGIKGTQALDMIDEWKPYMDSQNKAELEAMRVQNRAQAAAMNAYAHVLQAHAAQQRADTGANKLDRVDAPVAAAKVQKLAAGGGGKPGAAAPYKPPEDQASKDALDIQAWKYIQTGNLPYRKGTGGGADRNDSITRRAGEIARELGMSAQEMASKPAEWKADAASLSTQTKKLHSIQGVLNSFHNNLDTWDSLAKGVKPALGGKAMDEFAKDLRKVDFTGIRSIDEVKLRIEAQFNDPTVSAMMVAAMAAGMDYARIMQGPQSAASLTEGGRKEAERLINASVDDKARTGVRAALESDTEGQVKGLRDQMDSIRKRLGMRPAAGGGAGSKGEYVELRKTKDGKTIGKKADGTLELLD